MHSSQHFCRRIFVLLLLCVPLMVPTSAQTNWDAGEEAKLNRGEVVVDQKDEGAIKYVVAKIRIDAPPDQVWRIVTNPYEFMGTISPRMKQVQVMTDMPELSVLKVTINPGFFLPPFTYDVESRYANGERIDFKRVGGLLKDFRGTWVLEPVADGKKTEVVYSMFVDPGIPVPQWIMRAGMRDELPRTLTAMRERVIEVSNKHRSLATRSILAVDAGSRAALIVGALHHS